MPRPSHSDPPSPSNNGELDSSPLDAELVRSREINEELASALQESQAKLKAIQEVAESVGVQSSSLTTRIANFESQLTDAEQKIEDSDELHEKTKTHESKCAALEETCITIAKELEDDSLSVKVHASSLADLKTKIEGLLPGATSAGLAKAFRDQKERFHLPKVISIGVFVEAILILVGLGVWTASSGNAVTWDQLAGYILRRVVIAAPCIWLAIFAGKRYVETIRIEEDYAYKEAVSAAFEGYKKQFAELGQITDDDSPIATLCRNQLATLSELPGRLYARSDSEESIEKAPAKIASRVADLVESLEGKDGNEAKAILSSVAKILRGV